MKSTSILHHLVVSALLTYHIKTPPCSLPYQCWFQRWIYMKGSRDHWCKPLWSSLVQVCERVLCSSCTWVVLCMRMSCGQCPMIHGRERAVHFSAQEQNVFSGPWYVSSLDNRFFIQCSLLAQKALKDSSCTFSEKSMFWSIQERFCFDLTTCNTLYYSSEDMKGKTLEARNVISMILRWSKYY